MSNPAKSADILIADDEPINLTILTQLLILEGYAVRTALSGELAIRSAASKPPNLIILDISMPPGLDGYEVCKHLKSRAASKDIPIIFISALHEPSDKMRAFQAGGQDFISKPFRIDDVRERVRTQLRMRGIGQYSACG
ncbi:response regulator [Desulfococcaceae bacterium HSG9]|nr:response regulator [Desulfococcaceae bacterium HSG9]